MGRPAWSGSRHGSSTFGLSLRVPDFLGRGRAVPLVGGIFHLVDRASGEVFRAILLPRAPGRPSPTCTPFRWAGPPGRPQTKFRRPRGSGPPPAPATAPAPAGPERHRRERRGPSAGDGLGNRGALRAPVNCTEREHGGTHAVSRRAGSPREPRSEGPRVLGPGDRQPVEWSTDAGSLGGPITDPRQDPPIQVGVTRWPLLRRVYGGFDLERLEQSLYVRLNGSHSGRASLRDPAEDDSRGADNPTGPVRVRRVRGGAAPDPLQAHLPPVRVHPRLLRPLIRWLVISD